jgi:hypothetical protein
MTDTIRRADSWEAQLTEEQRWQIYGQLKKFAWHIVQPWIVEQFKVNPPGRTALYAFKKNMAALESAHRIEEALSNRDTLHREMEQIGDMDPELQHAWLQLAQESTLKGDPKAGERYLKMARSLRADATKRLELQLKQQAEARAASELDIMKRKLELQEQKIADAQRVLEAGRGGAVDPQKLADEIDRILGRKS